MHKFNRKTLKGRLKDLSVNDIMIQTHFRRTAYECADWIRPDQDGPVAGFCGDVMNLPVLKRREIF
jgi:hypothetical protein